MARRRGAQKLRDMQYMLDCIDGILDAMPTGDHPELDRLLAETVRPQVDRMRDAVWCKLNGDDQKRMLRR